MKAYHSFIGVDMGKYSFVVNVFNEKNTVEYENTSAGIAQFLQDNETSLSNALCVVEATGGYELALVYALTAKSYAVHRADARKVKFFIHSFGSVAKTDRLDAKAIAHYAKERSEKLILFVPSSEKMVELFHLVQRRNDLKTMLVAEKNRHKSPGLFSVKEGIEKIITLLEEELLNMTKKIKEIIKDSPVLQAKMNCLKSVPGIGDIVAFELIIRLPELGTLTRKKIASLAGLAPKANQSGKFKGYQRTGHGRSGIKPILFMAAMAARNSKTSLKEFYEKLVNSGKKKMIALTALMRKILVIANARLKELTIEAVA
jgi:transposase